MTKRSLATLLNDADRHQKGARAGGDYQKLNVDLKELLERYFKFLSFSFHRKYANTWEDDAVIQIICFHSSYSIPAWQLDQISLEISKKVQKIMDMQQAVSTYNKHMISGRFNRSVYGSYPKFRPAYILREDGPFSNLGGGGSHPNPIEMFCVEVQTEQEKINCGDWQKPDYRSYVKWTARFLVVNRTDSAGFSGKTHELTENEIFVLEVHGDEERTSAPVVGDHRFGVIKDGFGIDQSIWVGGFARKATTLKTYSQPPGSFNKALKFEDGTILEIVNAKFVGEVPETHKVAAALYLRDSVSW